ncbi:acetamidase/formamidase family protein [Vagococcus carniphilus]|uniref:acetamidase/formamidase family protein n=1 Tax=Vagococcus carniphilus TaxID=218144 RepID=UPI00288D0AB8|nr:acetamidase/formamidase family protein [Vagococcus carniphilus]MDT2830629.1 acetamidase/formamidase family protein [Vagococcus carniphilus]MDT2839929.1 acetamidase/formamidase family protein [Vagococcus carniphilus]MDT2854625.1 acetamidase/formamidase family protein [Vagococcus carniphilus]
MTYIKKEECVYAMDKNNQPVCTVQDGEVVTFETFDCFTNQITSEVSSFTTLDWDRINPATGPVFIEGAEPGDTLKVEIQKIEIKGNATMVTGTDMGVIGDLLTENTVKILPVVDDQLIFSDDLKLPLNKMIGVIGVAPKDEPISCGTPDSHGGNMDCKEITEGTTLFLPVNVSGALFSLGDCHAAMADGEVSVCGAEVPCEVTVKLSVIKNKDWPLPFLIRDEKISTLSSKLTVDEACVSATKMMVSFVENYTDLTKGEAIHLLSLAGDLRICQVVDPNKTVRMELPLNYLKNWK